MGSLEGTMHGRLRGNPARKNTTIGLLAIEEMLVYLVRQQITQTRCRPYNVTLVMYVVIPLTDVDSDWRDKKSTLVHFGHLFDAIVDMAGNQKSLFSWGRRRSGQRGSTAAL